MYKYIAKYFLLNKVYSFVSKTAFPSLVIGLIGFVAATYYVLFVLPADAEQQEIYRILFLSLIHI